MNTATVAVVVPFSLFRLPFYLSMSSKALLLLSLKLCLVDFQLLYTWIALLRSATIMSFQYLF